MGMGKGQELVNMEMVRDSLLHLIWRKNIDHIFNHSEAVDEKDISIVIELIDALEVHCKCMDVGLRVKIEKI